MSQIEINVKVDTGAMSNLIPWECFKQLKHVHFQDTPIRLFVFGGGASQLTKWACIT